MNTNKVQDPAADIKFLGVVWLGRVKTIPQTVVEKIQLFPIPQGVKALQQFVG